MSKSTLLRGMKSARFAKVALAESATQTYTPPTEDQLVNFIMVSTARLPWERGMVELAIKFHPQFKQKWLDEHRRMQEYIDSTKLAIREQP